MYKTKIDLSEKTRRNVIVILNDRLADAIDLQSQVKQAHWNVKGPHFIALHELFDKISDLVLEQIDEIAERVTSLGGTAADHCHCAVAFAQFNQTRDEPVSEFVAVAFLEECAARGHLGDSDLAREREQVLLLHAVEWREFSE